MTSASTNWEEIKNTLKEQLTPTDYTCWIENLTFIKYSKADHTLLIEVENDFKKVVLEDDYTEIITSIAGEKFGVPVNIQFILFGEEKAKTSSTKTASVSHSFEREIMFNPRFTFENFVTGPNSAFAANASYAVADAPGEVHSPLFIYGDSGLGKTHLMNAIGIHIYKKFPDKKILFISSETFTTDFINASRENKFEEFKKKYRDVDVLLIDDIQFICGKDKTVEEVFNTYNTLYSLGNQMVFSSDRPPNDLLGLDERLVSRLSAGLIVDIKPPSYEIKVAILKNKLVLDNIDDPERFDEIIPFIADSIKTNVRELEGALNRVIFYGQYTKETITKGLAKKALKELIKIDTSGPTPHDIKKVVASSFGVTLADLDSTKRTRSFAIPRQIAIYLCREMTNLSFPKIAKEFGKDYSTIHHAYEKISKEREDNQYIENKIDEIEKILENDY